MTRPKRLGYALLILGGVFPGNRQLSAHGAARADLGFYNAGRRGGVLAGSRALLTPLAAGGRFCRHRRRCGYNVGTLCGDSGARVPSTGVWAELPAQRQEMVAAATCGAARQPYPSCHLRRTVSALGCDARTVLRVCCHVHPAVPAVAPAGGQALGALSGYPVHRLDGAQ